MHDERREHSQLHSLVDASRQLGNSTEHSILRARFIAVRWIPSSASCLLIFASVRQRNMTFG
jgi:hypothetical protein